MPPRRNQVAPAPYSGSPAPASSLANYLSAQGERVIRANPNRLKLTPQYQNRLGGGISDLGTSPMPYNAVHGGLFGLSMRSDSHSPAGGVDMYFDKNGNIIYPASPPPAYSPAAFARSQRRSEQRWSKSKSRDKLRDDEDLELGFSPAASLHFPSPKPDSDLVKSPLGKVNPKKLADTIKVSSKINWSLRPTGKSNGMSAPFYTKEEHNVIQSNAWKSPGTVTVSHAASVGDQLMDHPASPAARPMAGGGRISQDNSPQQQVLLQSLSDANPTNGDEAADLFEKAVKGFLLLRLAEVESELKAGELDHSYDDVKKFLERVKNIVDKIGTTVKNTQTGNDVKVDINVMLRRLSKYETQDVVDKFNEIVGNGEHDENQGSEGLVVNLYSDLSEDVLGDDFEGLDVGFYVGDIQQIESKIRLINLVRSEVWEHGGGDVELVAKQLSNQKVYLDRIDRVKIDLNIIQDVSNELRYFSELKNGLIDKFNKFGKGKDETELALPLEFFKRGLKNLESDFNQENYGEAANDLVLKWIEKAKSDIDNAHKKLLIRFGINGNIPLGGHIFPSEGSFLQAQAWAKNFLAQGNLSDDKVKLFVENIFSLLDIDQNDPDTQGREEEINEVIVGFVPRPPKGKKPENAFVRKNISKVLTGIFKGRAGIGKGEISRMEAQIMRLAGYEVGHVNQASFGSLTSDDLDQVVANINTAVTQGVEFHIAIKKFIPTPPKGKKPVNRFVRKQLLEALKEVKNLSDEDASQEAYELLKNIYQIEQGQTFSEPMIGNLSNDEIDSVVTIIKSADDEAQIAVLINSFIPKFSSQDEAVNRFVKKQLKEVLARIDGKGLGDQELSNQADDILKNLGYKIDKTQDDQLMIGNLTNQEMASAIAIINGNSLNPDVIAAQIQKLMPSRNPPKRPDQKQDGRPDMPSRAPPKRPTKESVANQLGDLAQDLPGGGGFWQRFMADLIQEEQVLGNSVGSVNNPPSPPNYPGANDSIAEFGVFAIHAMLHGKLSPSYVERLVKNIQADAGYSNTEQIIQKIGELVPESSNENEAPNNFLRENVQALLMEAFPNMELGDLLKKARRILEGKGYVKVEFAQMFNGDNLTSAEVSAFANLIKTNSGDVEDKNNVIKAVAEIIPNVSDQNALITGFAQANTQSLLRRLYPEMESRDLLELSDKILTGRGYIKDQKNIFKTRKLNPEEVGAIIEEVREGLDNDEDIKNNIGNYVLAPSMQGEVANEFVQDNIELIVRGVYPDATSEQVEQQQKEILEARGYKFVAKKKPAPNRKPPARPVSSSLLSPARPTRRNTASVTPYNPSSVDTSLEELGVGSPTSSGQPVRPGLFNALSPQTGIISDPNAQELNKLLDQMVDPDSKGKINVAEAQEQIAALFSQIPNNQKQEFFNELGPNRQNALRQANNREQLFVSFGESLLKLAPPKEGQRILTPQEREQLTHDAVKTYQLLGGVTNSELLQLTEAGLSSVYSEVEKISRNETSQPIASSSGATFGLNKANCSRSGKKRADTDSKFIKEIKDHIEKDGGNDFLVKLDGRDDAVILREKDGSKQVIAVNESFENLNNKLKVSKAEGFEPKHLDNLGDYFGLADNILEVSLLDRQKVGETWTHIPTKKGFPDLPIFPRQDGFRNAGGISINNKNQIKISILDAGEHEVESVFYVRPKCLDPDLIPFPLRLEVFYQDGRVEITAINSRGNPVTSDSLKRSDVPEDKKILGVLNSFSVEMSVLNHDTVQGQDRFTQKECHKKANVDYDKRIGLTPRTSTGARLGTGSSAIHASSILNSGDIHQQQGLG